MCLERERVPRSDTDPARGSRIPGHDQANRLKSFAWVGLREAASGPFCRIVRSFPLQLDQTSGHCCIQTSHVRVTAVNARRHGVGIGRFGSVHVTSDTADDLLRGKNDLQRHDRVFLEPQDDWFNA